MPEWVPILGNLLCVLFGIIITHSLFLYYQFYREAEGYFLRAARKLWFFLFLFFTVEWVIGAIFFFLAVKIPEYVSIPLPLLALFIGVVIAAIPTVLELLLLPKAAATIKTVQRRITRFLVKLRIMLRHTFAWAIESCREQDVFDCQKPSGWGFDLPPSEIGRRIRKCYEFNKYKIAEDRKDPSLLHYDIDHTPWDQFYVLVRHIGRKRLRECIANPLEFRNWNGSERRRRNGTKDDRDGPADSDPSRSRLYDSEDVIRRCSRRQIGARPI